MKGKGKGADSRTQTEIYLMASGCIFMNLRGKLVYRSKEGPLYIKSVSEPCGQRVGRGVQSLDTMELEWTKEFIESNSRMFYDVTVNFGHISIYRSSITCYG